MELRHFLNNANSLLEGNIAFFSRKADPGRSIKAKGIIRYYKGIDRNSSGHAVTKWLVPSASHPGKKWSCYISIEPSHGTLFSAAQGSGRLSDRMALIKNADVRCFCTCPDFKYSGAAYNMKHLYDGYEPGHSSADGGTTGEDIPPNQRDPGREHMVCKHLLASFKGIMLNAARIIKDARLAKFPAEHGDETGPSTPLNGDSKKQRTPGKGKITAMNGSGGTAKPSGDIGIANSDEKKPVLDYDDDARNIKILGESAPVTIPEADSALDALSKAIGHSDEQTPGDGNINVVGEDPQNDTDGHANDEITMMNGSGDGQKFNPLTDIEDAAKLPMFNPETDDDESLN